jgi:integrase
LQLPLCQPGRSGPPILERRGRAVFPAGADIVTIKGKPHARFTEDGRTVTAPLTRKGDRIRLLSAKWYGEYRDAEGILQRVPLSTDEAAAQVMLGDLVRDAELTRRGLADPSREEQARRPLGEHAEDYRKHLTAKGDEAGHVADTAARVKKILDGCRFKRLADITPATVVEYLDGLLRQAPALPALDPAKESYTKKELAALLGVTPSAIPPMVRRHRLAAEGKGKTRRFPKATAEALRGRAAEPVGPRTVNAYLVAIKAFTRWLVKDRRATADPLAHLSGWNAAEDVRHARRALPPAELGALLQATQDSPKAFRGLDGRDRHFLYLCAMGTGFRAGELASLQPESFALDAEPPAVVCRAGYTKNGKTATQPLPAEIAEALRGYLADRPAGQPVWPGSWHERGADMLRDDLEAARIPYVVEGPDGPLFADFHALRHSYVALLDRAGLTLKQAMQLARHSDPKRTMAVYGRAALHDLGAAVDRLPGLVAKGGETFRPALRATGTEGAADAESATPDVPGLPPLTGPGVVSCRVASEGDSGVLSDEEAQESSKPRISPGFGASGRKLSSGVGRVGDRTRTGDILIHSRPDFLTDIVNNP